MQCGIIMTRAIDISWEFDNHYGPPVECILHRSHSGPHVVRTPSGKFFAWEYDFGCTDCIEDADECECCTFWEIKESDIPKL